MGFSVFSCTVLGLWITVEHRIGTPTISLRIFEFLGGIVGVILFLQQLNYTTTKVPDFLLSQHFLYKYFAGAVPFGTGQLFVGTFLRSLYLCSEN